MQEIASLPGTNAFLIPDKPLNLHKINYFMICTHVRKSAANQLSNFGNSGNFGGAGDSVYLSD